ncbi:radical SAM protein [Thermodesulfobacteriota bacterium]
MPYVFGPVPSRRLGLSLGIDLVPAKTCTYDCLYCQVGKTTSETLKTEPYVPLQDVIKELERHLEGANPETITLAGSGEPTLHSGIGQLITEIKGLSDIKIALLTNGSLLWQENVRERILGADIILPTLTSAFEATFRAIHRPHSDLRAESVIKGLKELRRIYRGLLFLEVMLLRGFNDSDREIEGLKRVINDISPDRVQLNTVERPPSDPKAQSLDKKRLEEIKNFLGDRVEIVAEAPFKPHRGRYQSVEGPIMEMTRRRPMRAIDIAQSLDLSLGDVEGIISGLVVKGALQERQHSREIYYLKAGGDFIDPGC